MERKSSVQQACHNNVEDVLSDPFLSLQTSNVNVIKHLQVWCGLEGHDVTRCWPLYCLQVAQHCGMSCISCTPLVVTLPVATFGPPSKPN